MGQYLIGRYSSDHSQGMGADLLWFRSEALFQLLAAEPRDAPVGVDQLLGSPVDDSKLLGVAVDIGVRAVPLGFR